MTDALAVNVEEAAKLSGLARTTIFREISTGRLRSFKVGKRRLIRVASLNAYLERRELLEPAVGPTGSAR